MSAEPQPGPSTSTIPTKFNNMTDSQLRQTITNLSSQAYVTPAPLQKNYLKNVAQWSTSTATLPKTPGQSSSRRTRTARSTPVAQTPAPTYTPPVYHPPPQPMVAAPPPPPPNPPRPPLPTAPQALHSTYASRMRTGCTLLMQPILASSSTTGTTRQTTRRAGAVNYADPGSGDDLPDAGALESDDSDFVASGGTRTAVRNARARVGVGQNVFHAGGSTRPGTPQPKVSTPTPAGKESTELDQSYLGQIPPARFIKARSMAPTPHEYPSQAELESQAMLSSALIPIRVEFETDSHRIRDCFVWNIHEKLLRPESFAKAFCADLDLPAVPWIETIAAQIRAQIEEHEAIASLELSIDDTVEGVGINPECRVLLSIDVQIGTYHLVDYIEWDLRSELTPEDFATTLCSDLGLGGEAIPLVAHAVHEELAKHRKDALDWGVLNGIDSMPPDAGGGNAKDRTGLFGVGAGLRGPRALRSIWRDWADAEEFQTKFEVLTAEEVERREIERERASRRLRRETSKFQSSTRTRRR